MSITNAVAIEGRLSEVAPPTIGIFADKLLDILVSIHVVLKETLLFEPLATGGPTAHIGEGMPALMTTQIIEIIESAFAALETALEFAFIQMVGLMALQYSLELIPLVAPGPVADKGPALDVHILDVCVELVLSLKNLIAI